MCTDDFADPGDVPGAAGTDTSGTGNRIALTMVVAPAQPELTPAKPNASMQVPGKVHIHQVLVLILTSTPVLIPAVRVMYH